VLFIWVIFISIFPFSIIVFGLGGTNMAPYYDVIIIGAGPAGIFTALELARSRGPLKMLLLEKGHNLAGRVCLSQERGVVCRQCQPCSVICGWGGAGAFSDGKLTLSTEVGGMLDQYLEEKLLNQYIAYIDAVYRDFGAPEKVYGYDQDGDLEALKRRSVLADLKLIPVPLRHLGTGRTKEILQRMQDFLLAQGLEVMINTTVAEILAENGRVRGIVTADGAEILGRFVVVAPGRQGAEWLAGQSQRLGLKTVINPVDVGVRVEVPAAVMKELTDVVYEPKLLFYSKTFDDKVRTFCVNPYGEVVQENNEGIITVNGHAHAEKKTENTNFALLVSKTFTEPFKEPIAYGKYVARLANLLGGGILVQRLGDLLVGQRSTRERLRKGLVIPTLTEATPGDLSLVFPYRHLTALLEMLQALDKIAPGVNSRHTLLYGVEVKFYSSRLELSPHLETEIKGLYAAGDGAGVTRGLAQASVAGVIAARDILNKLN
jgi:uncharacterized FAD-dependent dehydrogenase